MSISRGRYTTKTHFSGAPHLPDAVTEDEGEGEEARGERGPRLLHGLTVEDGGCGEHPDDEEQDADGDLHLRHHRLVVAQRAQQAVAVVEYLHAAHALSIKPMEKGQEETPKTPALVHSNP